MKPVFIPLLAFSILSSSLHGQSKENQPGSLPVEFTVVTSEGEPVEGATVKTSQHGMGTTTTRLTDAAGKARFVLDPLSTLHIAVEKEDHYRTSGILFRDGKHPVPEHERVSRKLESSYTVELKEIRNPVFLRHLRESWIAPRTGEWIGLDLKEGDWVDPHGMGETVDLEVRFDDIELTKRSYFGRMRLRFPNEGDGLIPFRGKHPFTMEYGSEQVPPLRAPTKGYIREIERSRGYHPGESFIDEEIKDRHYLFRTRTRKDASGRIIQACYGWILGEIRFDPRGRWGPVLNFEYFLNPDPDPEARSLEYINWVDR